MVDEARIQELRKTIRDLHGCDAAFVESVKVLTWEHVQVPAPLGGFRVTWEGRVGVFDLTGHPSARRAYAWAFEPGDGRRRLEAVLHAGRVDSPDRAVDSSIVADVRSARWREGWWGSGA